MFVRCSTVDPLCPSIKVASIGCKENLGSRQAVDGPLPANRPCLLVTLWRLRQWSNSPQYMVA